jgi:hypothetical protein
MDHFNSRPTSAKEVIIAYSLNYAMAKIAVYSAVVLLGFYLIYLTKFDYVNYTRADYTNVVIAIGMILYFGNYILKEISKLKKKLIISDKGITVENIFHSWKSIRKETVTRKKEHSSSAGFDYEGALLQFASSKGLVEVNLFAYKTNEETVTKLIKSFRNQYNQANRVETISSNNVFNNIIGFDAYLDLNEKESIKKEDEILKLAEANENDLIEYCRTDVYNKLDQLEFLYYVLSEDYKRWESFLVAEFIRMFEMSKTSDDATALIELIETITQDDNETLESQKIAQYLSKELDNKNPEIQLNALFLIEYWIDENTDQTIITKIKSKLQDPDRRVRWNAYRLIKDCTFIESSDIKLSFMDKIKGRF